MTFFLPLQSWTNERVEYEMDLVESTVRSLRSLRAELLAKQKNERFTCEALFFSFLNLQRSWLLIALT